MLARSPIVVRSEKNQTFFITLHRRTGITTRRMPVPLGNYGEEGTTRYVYISVRMSDLYAVWGLMVATATLLVVLIAENLPDTDH